jgi:hypothetical protein
MFSDPLSVTVDGSAKSLSRIATSKDRTQYKTANDEFQVFIWNTHPNGTGSFTAAIELQQNYLDPTPDPYQGYPGVSNAFGISYRVNRSRHELDDLPILRAALLGLVNTAFETRLLTGEK